MALAVGTILVSGVGSYFAALSGVKVSLARITAQIEFLQETRKERDSQQSQLYKELEARVRELEYPRNHRPIRDSHVG